MASWITNFSHAMANACENDNQRKKEFLIPQETDISEGSYRYSDQIWNC